MSMLTNSMFFAPFPKAVEIKAFLFVVVAKKIVQTRAFLQIFNKNTVHSHHVCERTHFSEAAQTFLIINRLFHLSFSRNIENFIY